MTMFFEFIKGTIFAALGDFVGKILVNIIWIVLAYMLIIKPYIIGYTPEEKHEIRVQQQEQKYIADIRNMVKIDSRAILGENPNTHETMVNAVSYTITNNSPYRIYNTTADCEMDVRDNNIWKYGFISEKNADYILPGHSRTQTTAPANNISNGDPASVRCVPRYEVEKSDIPLQEPINTSLTNTSMWIDGHFHHYGVKLKIMIAADIRNNSNKTISEVKAKCTGYDKLIFEKWNINIFPNETKHLMAQRDYDMNYNDFYSFVINQNIVMPQYGDMEPKDASIVINNTITKLNKLPTTCIITGVK